MNSNKSIGIIGGGASGLLLSILLKRKLPNEVVIFESLDKVGKKLLQTGNGKGNISNLHIDNSCYNHDIDIKITAKDIQSLFKELGLKTKVDNEGRIYPYSEKASSILDIFLLNIKKYGVKVVTNCSIDKVTKTDNIYTLFSNNKKVYECDYVILATGGKASINFNNVGYDIANSLGHTIVSLAPSLVALKTKESTKALAGIRVKCKAMIYVNCCLMETTYGEVLFKDEGLSGIAIFMLSRHFQSNGNIKIVLDLCPDMSEDDLNEDLKENIEDKLIGYFPKMINYDLMKRYNNSKKSIGYIIKHYDFTIIDTYGFKNAQVTKGGVSLSEIDLATNESLKNKNLYILGEALDVDGTCGGYNLHYAFTSAYNCYLDILKKIQGEK